MSVILPMIVYTLRLAEGHFYVGRVGNDEDLPARLEQHESGNGSQWTKLHPVVDVHNTILNAEPVDEDAQVVRMAAKYGLDNVRGGSFCTPDLADGDAHVLKKMVCSVRGTCYHCDEAGHCANECPVTLAIGMQHGGDWRCSNCGDNHQFGRNKKCHNCGALRPAAALPAQVAPGGMKKGDWICPSCSDHQFEKNTECRKCKTPKRPREEEPAGPVPEEREVKKPRTEPELKSGDWMCASCDAHNYARNRACFKCKKAKATDKTETVANCVICTDKQAKVLLTPCGHLVLCQECAALIPATCPMCRGAVKGQQSVFQ
jgi:hypothetical protein